MASVAGRGSAALVMSQESRTTQPPDRATRVTRAWIAQLAVRRVVAQHAGAGKARGHLDRHGRRLSDTQVAGEASGTSRKAHVRSVSPSARRRQAAAAEHDHPKPAREAVDERAPPRCERADGHTSTAAAARVSRHRRTSCAKPSGPQASRSAPMSAQCSSSGDSNPSGEAIDRGREATRRERERHSDRRARCSHTTQDACGPASTACPVVVAAHPRQSSAWGVLVTRWPRADRWCLPTSSNADGDYGSHAPHRRSSGSAATADLGRVQPLGRPWPSGCGYRRCAWPSATSSRTRSTWT